MKYNILIKPETKEIVRTISQPNSKNFLRLMVEGFCYVTTIQGWNISFTNPDNLIGYSPVLTSQEYFRKQREIEERAQQDYENYATQQGW